MTTFEHAMVGVNGALALGLHHSLGWKIIALSAVAAIAPDWDGLPMLIDMEAYEHGHRVWGHSILSCVLLGMLLGAIDWRFDLIGRFSTLFRRFEPFAEVRSVLCVRTENHWRHLFIWMTIATMFALTQLPADAVVSGGKGLSDWPLKPFWPFSSTELVYPMIPWGDIGPTVIFGVGMLALIRWREHTRWIAISTLLCVTGYLLIRHFTS